MRKLLPALFLTAFLLRLPVLFNVPFSGDEALYAQILDEMKTSFPYTTYLGEIVPWKPPLMFYAHYIFGTMFLSLGFPVELSYRLPSVIFGSLSVVVLFLLIEKMFKDIKLAFLSALVFSAVPVTIILNTLLLTDNFFLLLALLATFYYIQGYNDNKSLFLGSLFLFLSFLTKTLFTLLPMGLVTLYYFSHARKKIRTLSLSYLPVLLAFVLLFVFYGDKFREQLMLDVTLRFIFFWSPNLILAEFWMESLQLFVITSPWLCFLLWKPKFAWSTTEEKVMSAWLLIALLIAYLLIDPIAQYLLVLMPPFSFFVASFFVKSKLDNFTYLFLTILFIFSIAIGFYGIALVGDERYQAGREVGKFVAQMVGKKNVTVIETPTLSSLYYLFHYADNRNYNNVNIMVAGMGNCSSADERTIALFLNSSTNFDHMELRKAAYLHRLHHRWIIKSFDSKPEMVVFNKILCQSFDIEKFNYSIIKEFSQYLVAERNV